MTILATKLYIPPSRSKIVSRPHLVTRLKDGLVMDHKLILISAPAGFGKTTLISEWIATGEHPVAWLSLDEGDNDPARFLSYIIAALQTIKGEIGAGLLGALQDTQPPSSEAVLTALLNEITTVPDQFVLVLDDYHVIDSRPVGEALTFLLEHLPPRMYLIIATREDPDLPLARLRARDQLTELRAADLRFMPSETAEFLNRVMSLNLAAEDIDALEARTEGWIAGLQLAAISMQGDHDTASFIESFTGSHRFVLDYLVEEVLQQQSEAVQNFLLRTSILERMCGPLCDSVLLTCSGSGQETLEYLERANLFIVPLDNERCWYRYHHLFAELLRQRLQQHGKMAEYHIRASEWNEDNGLEFDAFHHAAAANDVERTSRLIQGKGMPLHVRGALVPVLNWLESLPTTVLDERPILWVMYAGALTTAGQTADVEQKLKAAEAALQGAELDIDARDILGRIANNRAALAFIQYQADTAIVQALRALEYLRPDNLPVRNISTWALGAAYQQKGDQTAAKRAFSEAISISQTIEHTFVTKLATMGLGRVQETENRLYPAAETYRHALQLFGEYPLPSACEAYLGLARIYYEWNDLDAAEQHGQQSLRLARQWDRSIDRFIVCEVFLARLKLARGDASGASAMLKEAEHSVCQHNFVHRIPEVAAAQVLVLLRQGKLESAAQLAQTHELPFSQAQVCLAQGDMSSALAVLERLGQQMDEKGWQDERLKVMVLQAVALHAQGEKDKALEQLGETLTLAEPGGFIRLFMDEGEPMRLLLADFRVAIEKQSHNRDHLLSGYIDKLLLAFTQPVAGPGSASPYQKSDIVESLSERELEVLMALRSELNGPEIARQLIISLNTLRTHTKNIYKKLGVNSRRAAIRRAEDLDLF